MTVPSVQLFAGITDTLEKVVIVEMKCPFSGGSTLGSAWQRWLSTIAYSCGNFFPEIPGAAEPSPQQVGVVVSAS